MRRTVGAIQVDRGPLPVLYECLELAVRFLAGLGSKIGRDHDRAFGYCGACMDILLEESAQQVGQACRADFAKRSG